MNKHIDEGDANLNGTAAEDRLGATSQQAAPEGTDHEGSQASPDASGAGATDAGDGAGTAVPVSAESPVRSDGLVSLERVCRVDGCGARHDRNYLVCGVHWRMLPPELQGRINAAYRRVKATGLVNREYAQLSALAMNWLNAGGSR